MKTIKKFIIWFIFTGLVILGNLLIAIGGDWQIIIGFGINGMIAGIGASALGSLIYD